MSAFASAVAMVRPAAFQFNPGTAATNHFQQPPPLHQDEVQKKALLQFDTMVKELEKHNISVLVLQDQKTPALPDAVFPNNWFISLKGEILLCPMQSPARRAERRPQHIEALLQFTGAVTLTDWSAEENNDKFLEGTGSLVLDHANMHAFACRSQRSDETLFEKFCDHSGFEGSIFDAVDQMGRPIYHTNVMMCLGNGFSAVCEEAVINTSQRKRLREIVEGSQREIITLTFQQMESFAGNMLQLQNKQGEYILVMSNSAYNSLTDEQLKRIELQSRILKIDAGILETVGGGGVRCMMAELFPV